MPKAPRDRHWALSFSMMVFTASIIDTSEQLWWDRIPNEFLHPASLAQLGDTAQPKHSSPYHLPGLSVSLNPVVELQGGLCVLLGTAVARQYGSGDWEEPGCKPMSSTLASQGQSEVTPRPTVHTSGHSTFRFGWRKSLVSCATQPTLSHFGLHGAA